MATLINQEQFEEAVLKADIPVLVDFYRDGCIPCKRMSPILSQLEKQYDGRLRLVKLNTGFNEEIVDRYDVMSAPTLILFKNGEEIDRVHGVTDLSSLEQLINQSI